MQADPKRLLDVAKEIEMRLVYTNTNPGTGVSKPEIVRNAITWGHLREVTWWSSARSSASVLPLQTGWACHSEMYAIKWSVWSE